MTLFSTLAWPLASLAIALMFRKEVTLALGRVGRFKYRDLEVTFREDLRQAEELARSMPAPPVKGPIVLELDPGESKPLLVGRLIGDLTPPDAPPEGPESLLKLAASSPREAVERAWFVVGRALVRAARALGNRGDSGVSTPDLAARFLHDRGRLAGPEGLLVGLLRTLRDRAARTDQHPPTPDEARRFVDLALKTVSRIEGRG